MTPLCAAASWKSANLLKFGLTFGQKRPKSSAIHANRRRLGNHPAAPHLPIRSADLGPPRFGQPRHGLLIQRRCATRLANCRNTDRACFPGRLTTTCDSRFFLADRSSISLVMSFLSLRVSSPNARSRSALNTAIPRDVAVHAWKVPSHIPCLRKGSTRFASAKATMLLLNADGLLPVRQSCHHRRDFH